MSDGGGPATTALAARWREVSGLRLLAVVAVTGVLFGLGAGLGGILTATLDLTGAQSDALDAVLLPVTVLGSVLLPLWWLVLRQADGPLLGFTAMSGRWLVVAVVAGAAAIVLGNLLSEGISQLLGAQRRAQVEFADTPVATLVLLVEAGLAAPIAEEVVFRGVVFNWLRARIHVWAAIAISAALFAAVHVNPVASASLFLFGVLLAWLHQRTESLWVPIAAHVGGNSLVIVLNALL